MNTPRHWSRLGPTALALLPLAVLFACVAALRRKLFRLGAFASFRLPVPVVVVGNITAGGTGKTPFALWLVADLRAEGFTPGIVTRGYGGTGPEPSAVPPDGDPAICGDEPVLLARRGGCPVWRGRDRVATGRALLAAHPDCNVIVCDDGLQHYRLRRDAEIVLIDGARGVGNGLPIPAGPLREPVSRLRSADAVVINGAGAKRLPHGHAMRLVGTRLSNLRDATRVDDLATWRGRRVHAVAGIGNPGRFFDSLRAAGLDPIEHAFPDHHAYAPADLDFGDGDVAVVMTEKDAVKCAPFAQPQWWVLPVDADVDAAVARVVAAKLAARSSSADTATGAASAVALAPPRH